MPTIPCRSLFTLLFLGHAYLFVANIFSENGSLDCDLFHRGCARELEDVATATTIRVARETLYWALLIMSGGIAWELYFFPERACFIKFALTREELIIFDNIRSELRSEGQRRLAERSRSARSADGDPSSSATHHASARSEPSGSGTEQRIRRPTLMQRATRGSRRSSLVGEMFQLVRVRTQVSLLREARQLVGRPIDLCRLGKRRRLASGHGGLRRSTARPAPHLATRAAQRACRRPVSAACWRLLGGRRRGNTSRAPIIYEPVPMA